MTSKNIEVEHPTRTHIKVTVDKLSKGEPFPLSRQNHNDAIRHERN
jgi:hypothetical protein